MPVRAYLGSIAGLSPPPRDERLSLPLAVQIARRLPVALLSWAVLTVLSPSGSRLGSAGFSPRQPDQPRLEGRKSASLARRREPGEDPNRKQCLRLRRAILLLFSGNYFARCFIFTVSGNKPMQPSHSSSRNRKMCVPWRPPHGRAFLRLAEYPCRPAPQRV